MPGCGKSYHGLQLSKKLNRQFYDLDTYMEQYYGMPLPQLFAAGETSFRQKEREALEQLLAQLETPAVLAMGGGTPAYLDNIKMMQEAGVLLWIDADIPTLMKHILKQPGQRPLLANRSLPELEARLRELYRQRLPYYQQATWTIPAQDAGAWDNFIHTFNNFSLQDNG